MATIENLIPFSERSKEEARLLGSKGGIASGKVRQEKKLLKDLLEEALLTKTDTGNKYIDITRAIIEQAAIGNVKAYEVIRDTMNQKPIDRVKNNIIVDNKLKDILEELQDETTPQV
jgi:hypothetical protein